MHRVLQALRAKAKDLAKSGWGAEGHCPGVAGCEVPHEVLFPFPALSADRVSGGAGGRKRAWDAGNELFPVAWMRITQGPLGKMCVKAIQKSLRVNVLEVLKDRKSKSMYLLTIK